MICPDCTGGEHHPSHEVSTIDIQWDTGEAVADICRCPCAEQMLGPHKLNVGESGYIFAGRYVDRNIHVDAIQGAMYVGTVLNHLSQPTVVHVPTTFVRRIDA